MEIGALQPYRVNRWLDSNGELLRYEFPLSDESIVFDLGGYRGDWAAEMFSRYKCQIYIFEPVPKYYEEILKRFEHIPKIKVFNFGLGSKLERIPIGIDGDASSLFLENAEFTVQARVVPTHDFFNENGIEKIDLMKINIEGSEYDLLSGMIDHDLAKRVEYFQIQFHEIDEVSDRNAKEIRGHLIRDHEPIFVYDFVWETWRRTPVPSRRGTLGILNELTRFQKIDAERGFEMDRLRFEIESLREHIAERNSQIEMLGKYKNGLEGIGFELGSIEYSKTYRFLKFYRKLRNTVFG